MKRRERATLLLVLMALLLLGSLLAACGDSSMTTTPALEPEQATAPPAKKSVAPEVEGRNLLEERCTMCHDLGRVESAQKTEEEWKTTVERMVANGAPLDQPEQELLVEYLTQTCQ